MRGADASRRPAVSGGRHPGQEAGRHHGSGRSSHLGSRSTSRCRGLVHESFLRSFTQVIGTGHGSRSVVERSLGLSGSQPGAPPIVSAVPEGSSRTPHPRLDVACHGCDGAATTPQIRRNTLMPAERSSVRALPVPQTSATAPAERAERRRHPPDRPGQRLRHGRHCAPVLHSARAPGGELGRLPQSLNQVTTPCASDRTAHHGLITQPPHGSPTMFELLTDTSPPLARNGLPSSRVVVSPMPPALPRRYS